MIEMVRSYMYFRKYPSKWDYNKIAGHTLAFKTLKRARERVEEYPVEQGFKLYEIKEILRGNSKA